MWCSRKQGLSNDGLNRKTKIAYEHFSPVYNIVSDGLDRQHGSAKLGWNIRRDTCEETNLLFAFIVWTVRDSKRLVMIQNHRNNF